LDFVPVNLLIIDCEFYVVINKTDKLLIFLFSIGNCHFNDIWHFVDWINFIGIAWFLSMYFTLIDKVLLGKEVRQKDTD
jgi:hypothetical protein